MEKIGFVGTGAMGTALLSRLKIAGVSATAFDIVPEALEQAKNWGPSLRHRQKQSLKIDPDRRCCPHRSRSARLYARR